MATGYRGIVWTEEERAYIARESLLKLATSPQLTRVQAIKAAVAGLPKARQRFIKEMPNVPWIEAAWAQLRRWLRPSRLTAPPALPQPLPSKARPAVARLPTRRPPDLR